MPMARYSSFQSFKSNLELDLQGPAWRPHGKWIVEYPRNTRLFNPYPPISPPSLSAVLAHPAMNAGVNSLWSMDVSFTAASLVVNYGNASSEYTICWVFGQPGTTTTSSPR